jgi:DNA-directed RNA polymerase specialized sigma24 family protein
MMPSENGGSITHCIPGLKAGDDEAVRRIWERYFRELVRLAHDRLGHAPRAAADEEDIALSAFYSLCEGAAQDRFAQLGDRDDLWRLLATITSRKALGQLRRQSRRKRGGPEGRQVEMGLERLPDAGPAPDVAAAMAEEVRRLLGGLASDSLRQVALLRMEGYSGEEIAERLGCNRRTITRKLDLIRQTWIELGSS